MSVRTRQSSRTTSTSASTTSATTWTNRMPPATMTTSPQDSTAFIEQCIARIMNAPMPVLSEIHEGFPQLPPGETPRRPMNIYIMFRAWVSQVIGPKGTHISGKIWKYLKTISPKHRILIHMDFLADQHELAHKFAYPNYVYQPQPKGTRRSRARAPYKRARRGKVAKVDSVEDELPVASGSGQNASEDAALGSGTELTRAQEYLFGPYRIPDGSQQAEADQEGSFGLYNIPDDGRLDQGYLSEPYAVPDVGYFNQGGQFILPNNIPDGGLPPAMNFPFSLAYTQPSPTPSLGMTATPPEECESFMNPLTTPPSGAWGLTTEEPQQRVMMSDGIEFGGRAHTWSEFHEWIEQQLVDLEFGMSATKVGF